MNFGNDVKNIIFMFSPRLMLMVWWCQINVFRSACSSQCELGCRWPSVTLTTCCGRHGGDSAGCGGGGGRGSGGHTPPPRGDTLHTAQDTVHAIAASLHILHIPSFKCNVHVQLLLNSFNRSMKDVFIDDSTNFDFWAQLTCLLFSLRPQPSFKI